MSKEEWDRKKDSVIVKVDNVHTDKQLVDFFTKLSMTRDELDNVQYKYYLIPDFQPGKSCIIIKSHHVLFDGLGASTMFMAMSDEFNVSALPGLKPQSLCKKIMIYSFLPFLVLRSSLEMLLTFKDHNVIKNKLKNSGNKNGAFVQDLNIIEAKEVCKKNQCTINDFMTAVLSVTFHEYFTKHQHDQISGYNNGAEGFKIPKKINLGMPFSLR